MSFGRKQPLPPSDELRQRLGANVRRHRKRLGISQEEFAFRAEMHPTAVSQLEIGQTVPYIHTFVRVAGGLGVTTDDLTAGILWTPPETIITRAASRCRTIPISRRRSPPSARRQRQVKGGNDERAGPVQGIALRGEGANRGQRVPLAEAGGLLAGRPQQTGDGLSGSDRQDRERSGHRQFDSYVRLAGALSVPVHDLLAGVTWTPASIEMEIDATYEVEFDVEGH